MKKKILALLSAAAMTVTALAVPFTASANEIENVVFQPTEWRVHENKTGGGKVTCGDTEYTKASSTFKGTEFTLNMPKSATNAGSPIQVRYGLNGSGQELEAGTYTLKVDYTANISSTSTAGDIVYGKVQGGNDFKPINTGNVKLGEEMSGTIEKEFTVAEGSANLEIQLYLRRAHGTVTFSNIRVTTPFTSDDESPEGAVASFTENGETRYFTDLAEAVKAAGNNSTIEVLDDTTLSERVLLNNSNNGFGGITNLTINGNGHTISAPEEQNMAFEVPNSGNCVLTINNATIGCGDTIRSGSAQAINVRSGGTLNLNNVTVLKNDTVNSTALRVESATVNAKGSTINSVLFNSPTSSTKIDLDSTSYIDGTIKIDGTAPTEALTLITGTPANCRATVEGDYENNNGVISPKPTTPTGTITMTAIYKGSYEGDEDGSTAAAYTAEFTTDSEEQMGFNTKDVTWTLGDTSLKLSADSSEGTQISVTKGFEVTYGIIINGVFYDAETSAETLSASFN